MLVSVIIPSYNRARTIERAVNSVLGQTWKALEVIVVDSESTDGTAEILAAYGDKIRVLRQKKEGPGAARNAGIKAAKGEIIAFLDSDDEWLPDKTERQVKLLEATASAGVTCCVCNARMNFITGPVYSFAAAHLNPEQREGIWTNPSEVLATRFLFFNQVAAIRREALTQIGFFKSGIMEDYDLALRLSVTGPWAFISDPLVVWHEQAGDNLSRTHSEFDICQRTLQILKEVSGSTDAGPLLPAALLRRRIRFLEKKMAVLNLSGPLSGIFGKSILSYMRLHELFYWRLPSTPKMLTKGV